MKTAIITGGSGAIGIEIVKSFVLDGYCVTAQYNSNREPIDNLISWLKSQGIENRILPIRADFNKIEQVKSLFLEHIKAFGQIDVLVNNAGVDFYCQAQDLLEEDYDRVFNINTKAPIFLTSLSAEKMIEKKSGKIIFISSIWGISGGSIESVYSASKSSLIGYCKALAKELGPSNIRVNCVCPGVIKSPMNDGYSKEEIDNIIEKTPLSRLGEPKDVAESVLFLASEKASFITGQTLTIDGGFIL